MPTVQLLQIAGCQGVPGTLEGLCWSMLSLHALRVGEWHLTDEKELAVKKIRISNSKSWG